MGEDCYSLGLGTANNRRLSIHPSIQRPLSTQYLSDIVLGTRYKTGEENLLCYVPNSHLWKARDTD